MSRYYLRLTDDAEDTIYNTDLKAEASSAIQLTTTELKKMQQMCGLKGKPSSMAVTRAFITKFIGDDRF
jgi:K+/H+ antiporter YhaU regulatory subunit KhtT